MLNVISLSRSFAHKYTQIKEKGKDLGIKERALPCCRYGPYADAVVARSADAAAPGNFHTRPDVSSICSNILAAGSLAVAKMLKMLIIESQALFLQ